MLQPLKALKRSYRFPTQAGLLDMVFHLRFIDTANIFAYMSINY
ncbi:hypothetical protein OKW21_003515 [Catalinimonas alkaloidigena]|nr:hypothetical protein [Catalinimonas alkaloidigena]